MVSRRMKPWINLQPFRETRVFLNFAILTSEARPRSSWIRQWRRKGVSSPWMDSCTFGNYGNFPRYFLRKPKAIFSSPFLNVCVSGSFSDVHSWRFYPDKAHLSSTLTATRNVGPTAPCPDSAVTRNHQAIAHFAFISWENITGFPAGTPEHLLLSPLAIPFPTPPSYCPSSPSAVNHSSRIPDWRTSHWPLSSPPFISPKGLYPFLYPLASSFPLCYTCYSASPAWKWIHEARKLST